MTYIRNMKELKDKCPEMHKELSGEVELASWDLDAEELEEAFKDERVEIISAASLLEEILDDGFIWEEVLAENHFHIVACADEIKDRLDERKNYLVVRREI